MNLGVKRARANIQPIKQVPQYGVDAYSLKVPTYFAGVRTDYVEELPVNPDASILEIGCGSGGTGALALSHKKCGRYCGVEIDHKASENARLSLIEVVTGNIEELDLPWPREQFDAVILSEVLEHLVDPWAVMRKLRPLLKPGGLVFASSPQCLPPSLDRHAPSRGMEFIRLRPNGPHPLTLVHSQVLPRSFRVLRIHGRLGRRTLRFQHQGAHHKFLHLWQDETSFYRPGGSSRPLSSQRFVASRKPNVRR